MFFLSEIKFLYLVSYLLKLLFDHEVNEGGHIIKVNRSFHGYFYTFTKCMSIKLGRVMTYSEGFLYAKSHDCLIMWSREVTLGGVTYYSRYQAFRQGLSY